MKTINPLLIKIVYKMLLATLSKQLYHAAAAAVVVGGGGGVAAAATAITEAQQTVLG
jgi:hypothetical protein